MEISQLQNVDLHSLSLRHHLLIRNTAWASENNFLHEHTTGSPPSILFRADDAGRHGNFHPASYRQILRNPGWKRRLSKTHSTAHRTLISHDPDRKELDSCNSSDALLMNIFCHPGASSTGSALRTYLGIRPTAPFLFGHKPRIPMKAGRVDCTEVDLHADDLLIEAKLTESHFQTAKWELVRRYRDFDSVFDPSLLPTAGDRLQSYQLVRGILSAFASETSRYCLLCDERRSDLIDQWFKVLYAIRSHDQRWRCILVTWQELSQTLPLTLRIWLQRKYGIAHPSLPSHRPQER